MRAPNPSLRLVAGLIGLLVVVAAIAALLGSVTVALAALAVLVGAVGALAIVLHRRAHQAAATARQAADRRLDAVEKSLATLVAGASRAESERKVILRRTNALRSSILTDQQAVQQLITRFRPEGPLPVVAGWALDPTALFWLVDHVDRARPQLVVECGSGTSTLWIALALRRNGSGRVVSLEHSEEFAASTRELLERHGLSDWAQVLTAPLVPVETARGTFPWYEIDPASLGPIDLLFIDGPPAATGKHARYPALPVLGGQLAQGAVVVLDDAGRDDEREVLKRWLAEDERLRPYANPGPDTRALILG